MASAGNLPDLHSLPWPVLAYAAMSLVTFGFYAVDKRRAIKGRRRIPERTLHGLELAGGWPGAFLAQHVVRHKRRKRSYQVVFWIIVVMHAGFWGWWWFGR